MNKKEVYVLYLEKYRDWSYESGACDLIGVYDDVNIALDKLYDLLISEEYDDRILGLYDSVDIYIKDLKKIAQDSSVNADRYNVDVYETTEDYDNGFNSGTYVIESRIINV